MLKGRPFLLHCVASKICFPWSMGMKIHIEFALLLERCCKCICVFDTSRVTMQFICEIWFPCCMGSIFSMYKSMKQTLKFLLSLEKLEIQVRKFKNKNPGGEFLAMISLWRHLVQQVSFSSLLARKILKFLRFYSVCQRPRKLWQSPSIAQVLRRYSASTPLGGGAGLRGPPGEDNIKDSTKD